MIINNELELNKALIEFNRLIDKDFTLSENHVDSIQELSYAISEYETQNNPDQDIYNILKRKLQLLGFSWLLS